MAIGFIMNLHDLVESPEKLETYDKYILPEYAYQKLKAGAKDQSLIDIVSKDAAHAYLYAKGIHRKRFQLGEKAISKDAMYSYYYARDVIRKRFPAGERAISKTPQWSFLYAENVLKGRFFDGETVIAANPFLAEKYAKDILKGPWPEVGIK